MNKIQEAYKVAKQARTVLIEIGAQRMEVTDDKSGIVWERWIVYGDKSFTSVILFATPLYWDIFVPLLRTNSHTATLDALRNLVNVS